MMSADKSHSDLTAALVRLGPDGTGCQPARPGGGAGAGASCPAPSLGPALHQSLTWAACGAQLAVALALVAVTEAPVVAGQRTVLER